MVDFSEVGVSLLEVLQFIRGLWKTTLQDLLVGPVMLEAIVSQGGRVVERFNSTLDVVVFFDCKVRGDLGWSFGRILGLRGSSAVRSGAPELPAVRSHKASKSRGATDVSLVQRDNPILRTREPEVQ